MAANNAYNTVEQVAARDGVTDQTVRTWIRTGISDGYLSLLEREAADHPYPLFPGLWRGQGIAPLRYATAERVGRDQIDKWFRAAEKLAGVPRVRGRGAYGLRRAPVDAAKAAGISREGLQAHGGWADTQMPDRIVRRPTDELRTRRSA